MQSEIDTYDEKHRESLDPTESEDHETPIKVPDPQYALRRKIEERLERKRFLEEFDDL